MPPEDMSDALEAVGNGLSEMAQATQKMAEAHQRSSETLATILQNQLGSTTQKIDKLSEEMRESFAKVVDNLGKNSVKAAEQDVHVKAVQEAIKEQKDLNKKVWEVLDNLRADRNKLWAGIVAAPFLMSLIVFLLTYKPH